MNTQVAEEIDQDTREDQGDAITENRREAGAKASQIRALQGLIAGHAGAEKDAEQELARARIEAENADKAASGNDLNSLTLAATLKLRVTKLGAELADLRERHRLEAVRAREEMDIEDSVSPVFFESLRLLKETVKDALAPFLPHRDGAERLFPNIDSVRQCQKYAWHYPTHTETERELDELAGVLEAIAAGRDPWLFQAKEDGQ